MKQALPLLALVALVCSPALCATAKITGYEIVADRSLIDGIKPLKSQFTANVGKQYSRKMLLDDVRRFQLLGTVGLVRTAQKPFKDGQKLLYRVEANPKIKSISFKGLTLFKSVDVLARFESQPGRILDYTRLFADINSIPGMYLEKKGIMYADVTDLRDVTVKDGHVTISVREFRMGELVVKGVKGPEAELVRKAFKVKKGSMVKRSDLLGSLCDIFQLSTVKDLDWMPRFDKEKGTVSVVLQVVPADAIRTADAGARGRSRGD